MFDHLFIDIHLEDTSLFNNETRRLWTNKPTDIQMTYKLTTDIQTYIQKQTYDRHTHTNVQQRSQTKQSYINEHWQRDATCTKHTHVYKQTQPVLNTHMSIQRDAIFNFKSSTVSNRWWITTKYAMANQIHQSNLLKMSCYFKVYVNFYPFYRYTGTWKHQDR